MESPVRDAERPAPSTSLVVNELIGSGWGNNGTEGVYRMANCTEVEIDTDQNAQWWLSQESGTAFTPPRSWTHVTGTEGDLSVDALAALAKATDIERSVPVPVPAEWRDVPGVRR